MSTGGDFETLNEDLSYTRCPFEMGDAYAFLSHKYHCVRPVRTGVRHVMIVELWEGQAVPCNHRCDVRQGPCTREQKGKDDEATDDAAALAEAGAESGRGLARGRHEIVVEADAALRLYGRETELRSVIDNLVSNAIHYSPDGGRVTVSWHGSPDGASLRVSDTGLGIDEADVDRITERFFRVDAGRSREQGGTGLGLAIVKHVLDCHEGWLDIHSKPGEGSSFICYFPEHRVHRAAPLAASG